MIAIVFSTARHNFELVNSKNKNHIFLFQKLNNQYYIEEKYNKISNYTGTQKTDTCIINQYSI